MDDPSEKIKAILSDPDSLKMLAQLASGFMGNSPQKPPSEAASQVSENIPDIKETIPNIAPQGGDEAREVSAFPGNVPERVISRHDYNDRINLLKSIRPYLNDHRKGRVDSLIQALSTAKIIGAYKDGNILGHLGQNFK